MHSLVGLVQPILGPLPLTEGGAQGSSMLRRPIAGDGGRGEEQVEERLLNNRVPIGGLRQEGRSCLDVRQPPSAHGGLRFTNDDDGRVDAEIKGSAVVKDSATRGYGCPAEPLGGEEKGSGGAMRHAPRMTRLGSALGNRNEGALQHLTREP